MIELTLGTLDLSGQGAFRIEALGTDEGTDWGNGQPVEEQLKSFLQSGSIVVNTGTENREVNIAVSIVGVDGVELAQAEAALMAELGKRNTLSYTPPNFAQATVFDVLTSNLTQSPNDLLEVSASQRLYGIRLVCLPFSRSATLTTIAALASPTKATTAVISDGSSATNWSGKLDGNPATITVDSSGDPFLQLPSQPATNYTFDYGVNVDFSTTQYVSVDYTTEVRGGSLSVECYVNGSLSNAREVANGPSPDRAGWSRKWWQVLATGPVPVSFNFNKDGSKFSAGDRVRLDNVIRTNQPPFSGSTKQLLRTITTGGSAPAMGSIALEHPSSSLGDALVYTCPAGDSYSPTMRPYRTSGGTVGADPGAVSGFSEVLGAGISANFSVPITALPEGEYLWMVRLKSSGTASLLWAHTVQVNGTVVYPSQTQTVAIPNSADFTFVRLGMAHLPVIKAGIAARVYVGLQCQAGSIALDELYLFNMTTGQLSQHQLGSGSIGAGGSPNRLWIDSPSLTNDGLGDRQCGYAPDRSDAFSAYPSAINGSVGLHKFDPVTGTKILTVTSNASSAMASFSCYRAWHTYAAS